MVLQYTTLITMPNIGNTLADKLITAGIKTPAELINLGSENAFIRLYTIDPGTCINMLYAMEGAVHGVRWHQLSRPDKLRLKAFYNSITQSKNNISD